MLRNALSVRAALSAALAGTVLLSVAGCGDGDEATSPAVGVPSSPTVTSPVSPSASPPTPTVTSVSPSASLTPSITQFRITVADGRIIGDIGKVSVGVGEPFQVMVSSDVADEVHVHSDTRAGFSEGVAAGGTATVDATINVAGVYEIEFEDSGTQLARVEVS